jgi:hypothetical protein
MKKKTLKGGPTPDDEFEMLLFVLNQEVLFARIHLQVARQLAKKASEKPQVLHCAPNFFAFTFRAHIESAYGRAGRLFDTRSGTVTIQAMLRFAEQKAAKFQFATPSEVRGKIGAWGGLIKSAQPLLERLRELRNGLIAHWDSKVVLDPVKMSSVIAVTFDDVEKIVAIAKEITDDALDSYNRSVYVDELITPEDIEEVFRIIEASGIYPKGSATVGFICPTI